MEETSGEVPVAAGELGNDMHAEDEFRLHISGFPKHFTLKKWEKLLKKLAIDYLKAKKTTSLSFGYVTLKVYLLCGFRGNKTTRFDSNPLRTKLPTTKRWNCYLGIRQEEERSPLTNPLKERRDEEKSLKHLKSRTRSLIMQSAEERKVKTKMIPPMLWT